PWGIKVLRYEIKNITPPADVLAAMEKQMRAEREKRATILTSEGNRDAAVNIADGDKQQVIKASEARRQQQVNEAEGAAAAILAIATATAEGIRKVAEATQVPGGLEAVQLRVAEQYVSRFGELAKEGNTLILPANLADVGSMIALAMSVIRRQPDGRSEACVSAHHDDAGVQDAARIERGLDGAHRGEVGGAARERQVGGLLDADPVLGRDRPAQP